MQSLLIEQKGPQGLMKTWRLRSEQKVLTFGRSKHADLRSGQESVKGIQGVFEYRPQPTTEHPTAGRWYYINLDLHTQHPQLSDGQTEFCIDQTTEIRFGVTTLQITPFDSRSPLFEKLESGEISQPGNGKHPYQLFTVHSGVTLLETKIVPMSKTFVSKFDLSHTKFQPSQGEVWKRDRVGEIEVSQRTVYLSDVEALKHNPPKQMIDEEGKRALYATLSGAFILALLFILSPKTNSLDDVLAPIPVTITPRQAKVTEPKKKTEPSAPKEETPRNDKKVAAAPRNQGGSSRSSSLIKNLASGRITQLVGKISASAARSHNVVVTSGVVAGSVPSGRALAAIGAISKSGKDWESEGKGTGVAISTNGRAGGKGVAGMGALGLGKTGQGGVGLLEDEGEIVGGLDREVIAAYIKSQLGQILYCYERQLSANPDLYGKVAVKFTIGGDGHVETQRIGDTTLKNATVEGCILQRVARWKFPAPDGGTKVLVTYPFLFKSTN
jgi:outer membrane biosynthesis protein TonB